MALELVSEILLPRLLAATVQSTLFVVAVWALCKALPRLSASARAGLWWLVALQLVVGVLWSSPLALPLLPAEVVQQVQAAPVHATVLSATPAASTSTTTALALSAAPTTSPWSSSWSWSTALAMLWLLGLAFMISRTLRGYLATRRLLDESRPCKDAVLLGALRLAAEAHGLRQPPRLRLSAAIDSPQLIGPWNPVLLLPATPAHSMHADELDMALTHELVHLQRHDLWWGLLPAVAQHLFFFHPLAHLAAHEYALAREAACDAAVIAGNRHCAHDYGRLLVRLGVAPKPSAGLASASPTFRILKRRLLMLQNTATTPRVVALLLTVAVAALGVVPYRIVAATQAGSAAPVARATPAIAPKPGEPAGAPLEALAPLAGTAELGTPVSATAPVAAVALGSAAHEMAPPPPPPAPTTPKPAPPAPPAAPTPSTVPAPPAAPAPGAVPAPATAPSPRALPAPPPPPAPLTGARATTRGMIVAANNDQTYVLLQGNNTLVNGSMFDIAEARRQQRNGEQLLWFRKGRASYVVRDPALLARFRTTFEETSALADAQGKLGDRQGELGEQQGRIGERQGEIGMQQAELAINKANSERQAALAAQQRGMAEQAQFLAERQAGMAREQAKLAEKQVAASARTAEEVKQLIEEALAKGVAQSTKG